MSQRVVPQYLVGEYRKAEQTSASIYADRAGLRHEIGEDLAGAGIQILHSGVIDCLIENSPALLGDIVIIDVPSLDGRLLAALSEIDMWLANSGAQLIVSTSIDALDEVFSCFDQSAPQILVNPTGAERVIAVGRIMDRMPNAQVSDLSREDRMALLRLSEQVEQVAKRLEGLEGNPSTDGSDQKSAFFGFQQPGHSNNLTRPNLPDPKLVRDIIRKRQARARFFDAELFADPAWDMLLDLTAAHAEHRRVSVTSLCIASGVPTTTALRWIRQLTDAGIFVRIRDASDRRRVFIALSDEARDSMAAYFALIGEASMAFAA